MNALGYEISPIGIGEMYKDFVDYLVIDNQDKDLVDNLKNIVPNVGVTNIMMKSLDIKIDLAKFILDLKK